MSLSRREQRLLSEIEKHLATQEPGLAQLLRPLSPTRSHRLGTVMGMYVVIIGVLFGLGEVLHCAVLVLASLLVLVGLPRGMQSLLVRHARAGYHGP